MEPRDGHAVMPLRLVRGDHSGPCRGRSFAALAIAVFAFLVDQHQIADENIPLGIRALLQLTTSAALPADTGSPSQLLVTRMSFSPTIHVGR